VSLEQMYKCNYKDSTIYNESNTLQDYSSIPCEIPVLNDPKLLNSLEDTLKRINENKSPTRKGPFEQVMQNLHAALQMVSHVHPGWKVYFYYIITVETNLLMICIFGVSPDAVTLP
jgi:hypothetical protein